jgi:hypothetical protein
MQPTRTPIPPTRGRPHGAAGCAFVLKSRTMDSANTSNESDAAQVDMRWSPLGTCDKTFLLFSRDYRKQRGHLATGESQLIFASDPITVRISVEMFVNGKSASLLPLSSTSAQATVGDCTGCFTTLWPALASALPMHRGGVFKLGRSDHEIAWRSHHI